jgi:large subunit ribosomal protein L33
MAGKGREKIKLVSTEGTGEYYTTTISKADTVAGDKLEKRKYDKRLRKHVLFKQAKIK